MKKNTAPTSYEVNRKIRKNWGDIKPITKVIPSKKQKKLERARRKEEY